MSYTNSIILGSSQDSKLQTAEGYQHILLLAPHGSGKGVAFVLPTLLSLDESCIVHDIKLENYQLTSGYRAKEGHKIFVFNPLGDKTHRYNPLDFISSDIKKKINDICIFFIILTPLNNMFFTFIMPFKIHKLIEV